ncbi:MAG: hypothetical protein ACXVX1_08380, partial [Mycobacterium sp.]
MTQGLVPATRRPPPAVATADLVVEAPPEPAPGGPGLLPRLLPAVLAVAGMGIMAAALTSRSGGTRAPMLLAFPIMMLASTVVTALSGRA